MEFPDHMEIDQFLAVLETVGTHCNFKMSKLMSEQMGGITDSEGRRGGWSEDALRSLFDKAKTEEEDRFFVTADRFLLLLADNNLLGLNECSTREELTVIEEEVKLELGKVVIRHIDVDGDGNLDLEEIVAY